MLAGESLDALARSLEALAECGGLHIKRVGRLARGKLQDLAQHVGEPMRPVETLEHPERATDLHLFREQGALIVRRAVCRPTVGEVVGKLRERQALPLHWALLDVQEVVGRNPVDPGLERAVEVESR